MAIFEKVECSLKTVCHHKLDPLAYASLEDPEILCTKKCGNYQEPISKTRSMLWHSKKVKSIKVRA